LATIERLSVRCAAVAAVGTLLAACATPVPKVPPEEIIRTAVDAAFEAIAGAQGASP
jgi:hypothetical protein